MKIGLICGMEVEARALGRLRDDPRVMVGISAAKPDRASKLARQLIAQDAEILVSWGIAGGLDPALPSGTLVVPQAVIDPDQTRLPSIGLQMAEAGTVSAIAGSDVIVPTLDAKTELSQRTSAVAVDMESHRVARAAQQAGLPCIVIRAISDPANRALPEGVGDALDDQGRPRVLPVLMGLLRHPGRLPALLAAKRDLDRGITTLGTLGLELLEGVLARRPSRKFADPLAQGDSESA